MTSDMKQNLSYLSDAVFMAAPKLFGLNMFQQTTYSENMFEISLFTSVVNLKTVFFLYAGI